MRHNNPVVETAGTAEKRQVWPPFRRRLSPLNDHHGNRGMRGGKAGVTILQAMCQYEFLKCLELMFTPRGVIQIFVEYDHGAFHNARREQIEDRAGG